MSLYGDTSSRLPDDLIAFRILPLLPFEEAVRTSVLSRRFSNLWRSIPSIVLDRRFHRDVLEPKPPPSPEDDDDNDDETHDPQLERVVDAVLTSHEGSILSFSIYASIYNARKTRTWLQTLASKGIRELTLASNGGVTAPLPMSLFTCTQLTSLKLQSFALVEAPEPESRGFPRLVTLELDRFYVARKVPSYYNIVGLVADCPRLEELTLRKCSVSATSLVTLHAPSLRRVHVCMCGTVLPDKVRGLLNYPPYCPNLTRVTFCARPRVSGQSCDRDRVHVRDLLKLLGAWSGVESLCFGRTELVRSNVVPGRLPTSLRLRRLKDLTLHRVDFHVLSEVSFLIAIVKSSPNLEKLSLIGSEEMEADNDCQHVTDFLKDEKSTLWKLGMVELRKVFVSGEPVRLLLRFLLESSPALETIAVEKQPRLVWQVQQELEQTSSKAKIVYLTDLPQVDAVDEHEP